MSGLRRSFGSDPSAAARGSITREERAARLKAEQQIIDARREQPVHGVRRTDAGVVIVFADGSESLEPYDPSKRPVLDAGLVDSVRFERKASRTARRVRR